MASVYLMRGFEEFRRHHEAKKWEWGQTDCSLVLADWAMWLCFPDPAEPLRGTYGSETGCRAVVAAAGGLVPLVEQCTARIGWSEIDEPTEGAIAVIGNGSKAEKQWGAIRHGPRWYVRLNDGFQPLIARPLKIWSA